MHKGGINLAKILKAEFHANGFKPQIKQVSFYTNPSDVLNSQNIHLKTLRIRYATGSVKTYYIPKKILRFIIVNDRL